MNKGDFLISVFLDFSEAFDTVNHNILLVKLNKLIIRGNCSNLIRSYLSDRPKYASINDFNTLELLIKIGVPHDSILGRLLFLIYINDM